jgi:hypothetical protein
MNKLKMYCVRLDDLETEWMTTQVPFTEIILDAWEDIVQGCANFCSIEGYTEAIFDNPKLAAEAIMHYETQNECYLYDSLGEAWDKQKQLSAELVSLRQEQRDRIESDHFDRIKDIKYTMRDFT